MPLELERLRIKCLSQPSADWMAQQVLLLIAEFNLQNLRIAELTRSAIGPPFLDDKELRKILGDAIGVTTDVTPPKEELPASLDGFGRPFSQVEQAAHLRNVLHPNPDRPEVPVKPEEPPQERLYPAGRYEKGTGV